MRRLVFLFAVLLALVPQRLFAAGAVTVTTANVNDRSTSYVRYTVAWTSSSGGAVSGNAFTVVPGRLVSVRFIPGTGGTQPTDQYDVTLSDGGVADLTAGNGGNLSNSGSVLKTFSPPIFQDGTRTFDVVVASAGDSKTGTVILLVQVR